MIRAALCGLLLAASPALSAGQAITVEWEYTAPSGPAVSGFRLYRDGTEICTFPDSEARSGTCSTELPGSFALTAFFADGTESEHSEPYFYPVSAEPMTRPVLLKIDIVRQ